MMVVAKDAVKNEFLTQTEHNSLFLAGCLFGAGQGLESPAESGLCGAPYHPRYIWHARNKILDGQIAALQFAAQKCMLQALSVSAISWVVSIMLHFSELSLYSSLTVAALGTVGSMGWLQKRW